MPPSTRSDPHRSGMVRADAAGRQVDLADRVAHGVGDVGTPLVQRRSPWGGCRPRRAGSAPVWRSIRLTVPEAGCPRSSTTMSRSWLLAVRSPGEGSRPPQLLTISVRSSSESLGSKGSVWTGYSRTSSRGQVDLGDGVAIGRGHEQPRAVASDRHPAGHRVARPSGLPRDGDPCGVSACRRRSRTSGYALARCWRSRRAVGRPDQPAEPCARRPRRGRPAPAITRRSRPGTRSLVQHGEEVIASGGPPGRSAVR